MRACCVTIYDLLRRRHTLYGANIVDIAYDDRPKLLYQRGIGRHHNFVRVFD